MGLSCVSRDHSTRIMQSQLGPELQNVPECSEAETLEIFGTGGEGFFNKTLIWKIIFLKGCHLVTTISKVRYESFVKQRKCDTQAMLNKENVIQRQCWTKKMRYTGNVKQRKCDTQAMLNKENVKHRQC